MKTNLLILSIFISSITIAQTKISITVQSFSFTPSAINITVGDTVEWTNIGGNHNVNGTQATFSGNPASFGNAVGSGWTYSYKFTTAGAYSFQCDPHSGSMTGTVNVQLATGVKEETTKNIIRLYPNPANNTLHFTNYKTIKNISIYSITGEKVLDTNINTVTVDISKLNHGTYFVKITTTSGIEKIEKLLIK